MWCKNCNLETNEAICPVCGLETSEDLPVEIYWCNDCRIPVIHVSTAADKGICPVCHGKTRYLTADLRPVFPEETFRSCQFNRSIRMGTITLSRSGR